MIKIKKPRKKRLNLEEKEQMALIEWAHLHDDIWPYLIHIRNEGKRSKAEGAKAKRMGLMKGVSDLFLAKPTRIRLVDELLSEETKKVGCIVINYSGFWIELKSKHGKPTNHQLNFLDKMKLERYKAAIFYSWTDAAKAICEYLGKDTHGL